MWIPCFDRTIHYPPVNRIAIMVVPLKPLYPFIQMKKRIFKQNTFLIISYDKISICPWMSSNSSKIYLNLENRACRSSKSMLSAVNVMPSWNVWNRLIFTFTCQRWNLMFFSDHLCHLVVWTVIKYKNISNESIRCLVMKIKMTSAQNCDENVNLFLFHGYYSSIDFNIPMHIILYWTQGVRHSIYNHELAFSSGKTGNAVASWRCYSLGNFFLTHIITRHSQFFYSFSRWQWLWQMTFFTCTVHRWLWMIALRILGWKLEYISVSWILKFPIFYKETACFEIFSSFVSAVNKALEVWKHSIINHWYQ